MNRILDFNHITIEEIKLFEEVIDEIRDEYHQLVAGIRRRTDDSIYWHVNSLLSRNNYMSGVFSDLCCIELVRKIEASDTLAGVIVTKQRQKKVLDRYFKSRDKQIPVWSGESMKSRLKRIVKPFYDFARNIHWSIVYFREKDIHRNRRIPRLRKIILIDTFFSAYIFKSGEFKERYYNGLIRHLTPKERKSVFFVPNVVTWRNLKNMLAMGERAEENFLYPLDFLKPADYVFAVAAPFFIRRIRLGDFTFRGVNIGTILGQDFRTNICRRSSFRGILLYRFFRRLKQEGIQLHLVIDWFENQVVDRGFNKGKKDFYEEIPGVGYQGLIGSYKWNFHFQPVTDEVRAGVIPEQVAVIGNGLVNIAGKYCPKLDVVVAPGLRFSGIHQTGIKSVDKFNPERPVILAALPIWMKDSLEILEFLLEAADLLREHNCRVLVKPHPSLNFKEVKSHLSCWPDIFTTAEGDFSTLIEEADLLFSAGSTVCMEAVAYGVPVIVAGSRSGVTKNVIPETVPKEIWELCHTKEEFTRALQRLCFDLTKKDREKMTRLARQIREQFFKPVSRKDVAKLLRLPEA